MLQGRLKVQVGDHIEYLEEGDSIYYNSSTPHGMIAVGGTDCLFLAVVLWGENETEPTIRDTLLPSRAESRGLVSERFVSVTESETGYPTAIAFRNEDRDGAFSVVYRRNDGGYGVLVDKR